MFSFWYLYWKQWCRNNFTKIYFFFQIIGVHFDKKIQFESLYFNVLCLIQCVTCHFYVIICEIY